MSGAAPKRVLLASNNRHKLIEFRRILGGSIVVVGAEEARIALQVDETGATMAENARIKALAFAAETDMAAIADDSGLEVDALSGAPGVHSSRFEGLGSDAARNRRLLELLDGVPAAERTARFRCAVVVVRGAEVIFETQATCEGAIAKRAGGQAGFGYDPIFVPNGLRQTFAEMGAEAKDRSSHRARALRSLRSFVEESGELLA
jgi:XTP/dITP diphosphohydrolase